MRARWLSSMCISKGVRVLGFMPNRIVDVRLAVAAARPARPRDGSVVGHHDREVHDLFRLRAESIKLRASGSPTTREGPRLRCRCSPACLGPSMQ